MKFTFLIFMDLVLERLIHMESFQQLLEMVRKDIQVMFHISKILLGHFNILSNGTKI